MNAWHPWAFRQEPIASAILPGRPWPKPAPRQMGMPRRDSLVIQVSGGR